MSILRRIARIWSLLSLLVVAFELMQIDIAPLQRTPTVGEV